MTALMGSPLYQSCKWQRPHSEQLGPAVGGSAGVQQSHGIQGGGRHPQIHTAGVITCPRSRAEGRAWAHSLRPERRMDPTTTTRQERVLPLISRAPSLLKPGRSQRQRSPDECGPQRPAPQSPAQGQGGQPMVWKAKEKSASTPASSLLSEEHKRKMTRKSPHL